MQPYRVFVHLELLEAIPRKSSQRRKFFQFLRQLESTPDASGDFTDKDDSLRVRQVKIIGDYAVTYWADHAVKAVMVVDVRLAD